MDYAVNILKFRTLFSLRSKINVGFQGLNSQSACQNSKKEAVLSGSALFV